MLKKRIISGVLALVMLLCAVPVVPVTAEAASEVWEVGTIASATGVNGSGTTRLRTADWLLLSDYSGVSIDFGYSLSEMSIGEQKIYR